MSNTEKPLPHFVQFASGRGVMCIVFKDFFFFLFSYLQFINNKLHNVKKKTNKQVMNIRTKMYVFFQRQNKKWKWDFVFSCIWCALTFLLMKFLIGKN